MAKPYDSTAKYLVEDYPADWLHLAGLGPKGPVEVVDANLSTITAEADKVIRVPGPPPSLAHVEWQTGREANLPRRLLRYNVLLDDRHDLPTRSIVILLRPKADGTDLTGVYRRTMPDGAAIAEFRYDVVRAWQLPVDDLLAGGLGTLPLAPVADLGTMTPAEVVRRMADRIDPRPAPVAGGLWSATAVLMGLRYPETFINELLGGVRQMEDSTYYQAILRKGEERGEARGVAIGEARGRVGEARRILIRQAARRFGPADEATLARLGAIDEVEPIEALLDRLADAGGWPDLLA